MSLKLGIRDLPLIGSSYNFVRAENGNVHVSISFVEAQPGRVAPLHRHTYDEIVVVQQGRSRVAIGDAVYEAKEGDVLGMKAGTAYGFVNTGYETLL